jgi:hypothetical protein
MRQTNSKCPVPLGELPSLAEAFQKLNALMEWRESQGRAIGEMTGMQRGMDISFEEGRLSGHMEGHRQGRQEGRLQAMRDILCRLLHQRFGRLPTTLRKQIKLTTDVKRLQAGLDQVLRIQSLDELAL